MTRANPVNLLGSLLLFVSDRGSDQDNPYLKLSEVIASNPEGGQP